METELGKPEWIDIARTFVTSLGTEPTEQSLRLLAPNVTYRVLGQNALSGSFTGRDEVAKHLASIVVQTDGRFDAVKFEDWMLGIRHVSVLADVRVEVGGATQELRYLLLLRFGDGDLVDEVTAFLSDPDVADRVFGHLLRDKWTPRES